MITIKNISGETLVLEQAIDTDVKGCRVVDPPVPPMQINPGGSVTMMGYEPGVSYTIKPARSPQYPRVADSDDPVLGYRAIAPDGVIL